MTQNTSTEADMRTSTTDDDRIAITNGFIERDGHLVPRNRRMKCARCEKWMTVDLLEPIQECPHCREVVVFAAAT